MNSYDSLQSGFTFNSMITNIKILISACQELKIPFEIIHPQQNLVRIKIGQCTYYFTNYSTPFNDEAIARILIDKDYTYHLFKTQINIPRTQAFLSPYCEEKYRTYLEYPDIDTMLTVIEQNFKFPMIVKRNSGARGNHVFQCFHLETVQSALEAIFNPNHKNYDYIALAQDYINIAHEYRIILFNQEILLIYEKDISQAQFSGNLSPLHWQNAKALLVENPKIWQEIEHFIQPICVQFPSSYLGIDIAQDSQGKYWLIEINSHPSYDLFIRDNGEKRIIEIFHKILESLM